ncbi:MAG: penicillin-binding protein 1C [Saprospiraceae bacterium]
MKYWTYYFSAFIILLLLSILFASLIVFPSEYSPLLYSKEGKVLAVKVAKDGQWRFKSENPIPYNYEQCLLHYEDKNYYYHLGFDPIGFLRAVYLNLKYQKVVSGGSTITMQLARLYLHSGERTVPAKILEIFLATGLEFRYSKKEILKLYAANAPYGSNVVGLEAALFRYYNKKLSELSWAEAAMFAVLPNQPTWIHVIKNRNKLTDKRNKLLASLYDSKIISKENYELSLLEPLPQKPLKVNRLASHALDYLESIHPNQFVFQSTIEVALQSKVQEICQRNNEALIQNEIRNLSAMIIDNKSGEVITYLGNMIKDSGVVANSEVNMVQAARSSGSILKPLLVAAAMQRGLVINQSLLPDVPVSINGFKPENFSRSYYGACTVNELLHYSLNIPSVLLLKEYGIPDFFNDLIKLGFSSLFRKPNDYGLSLILGGAEIKMWDLCRAYSFLVQNLNQYVDGNHDYLPISKYNLKLLEVETQNQSLEKLKTASVFSAGNIYLMFDAMRNPPPQNGSYRNSQTTKPHVAWKTGTSFGYKDAWCIGISPDYTVCVWVGNSNGLARPGLIGLETAAPIMFEIMDQLPKLSDWRIPYDDMQEYSICKESGYIAGNSCNEIDTVLTSKSAQNLKSCPYHHTILLDQEMKYSVYANCESNPMSKNYFILPPLMAHYYKMQHLNYTLVPPLRSDCIAGSNNETQILEFIYPTSNTDVVIPIDLDEDRNVVIFKAVHKNKSGKILWFIDDLYIGETQGLHELKYSPKAGVHRLMISDEFGNVNKINFNVVR